MTTSTNIRSRHGSAFGRQPSLNDFNERKQNKQKQQQNQQQNPSKRLVFSGKCSEIFKSTVIDCVDDCVLEFPGETSIYVPKSGQKASTNKLNSNSCSRDSNPNLLRSQKSTSRRNSMIRSNTFTISPMPSVRTRHPLIQQKFSVTDNITEEDSTVCETSIPSSSNADLDDDRTQIAQIESSSLDAISQIISASHRQLPSASIYSSHRHQQKEFRLSDLVMNGPEYYENVFKLSHSSKYGYRTRANTSKERTHIETKYDELDAIKRDLFHRYLWTQKPQVSCRIRHISSYTRSSSFIF